MYLLHLWAIYGGFVVCKLACTSIYSEYVYVTIGFVSEPFVLHGLIFAEML